MQVCEETNQPVLKKYFHCSFMVQNAEARSDYISEIPSAARTWLRRNTHKILSGWGKEKGRNLQPGQNLHSIPSGGNQVFHLRACPGVAGRPGIDMLPDVSFGAKYKIFGWPSSTAVLSVCGREPGRGCAQDGPASGSGLLRLARSSL